MTGNSTPASGGVTDDPIRIGTLLYTLVEPHRGHEVDYNRWYERDHFYAGCQIGAYNFAGARFVSTAPLKALRYPTGDGALVAVHDGRELRHLRLLVRLLGLGRLLALSGSLHVLVGLVFSNKSPPTQLAHGAASRDERLAVQLGGDRRAVVEKIG